MPTGFLVSGARMRDQRAGLGEIARIAIDAGRAIMQVYAQPEAWNVAIKQDASPVTQADLRANEIIVSALSRLAPEIPVLSEESPWTGDTAGTYWAVDPLDGTKEFLKRNGEFTVNIALVVNGIAQLGVICAPAWKTLWVGVSGDLTADAQRPWAARMELSALELSSFARGRWQEISAATAVSPQPLDVHADRQPGQSLPPAPLPLRMVVSRARGSTGYPAWVTPLLTGASITGRGSSLKFCLVAQGDADLYVRMGPTSIWDTAAGHAILAAAGGQVVHAQTRSVLTYPDPRAVSNPDFVAYGPRLTGPL